MNQDLELLEQFKEQEKGEEWNGVSIKPGLKLGDEVHF